MPDTFKNRFIEAMKIRGMRQIDVARKSGLPSAQISQYKNGKYEPMQNALYKLAKALDVNVAWLMGHDVPMEIDMGKLSGSFPLRELIKKRYGLKAYEFLELFSKLNDLGGDKIIEQIKDMLQLDKYTDREEMRENSKNHRKHFSF